MIGSPLTIFLAHIWWEKIPTSRFNIAPDLQMAGIKYLS
jgi:hypothetical protein